MWSMLAAAAFGASCETISMADVLAVPPPAVIVLGDRHGYVPDSSRATKIVRQLAARSPTVVALEALPADRQPVLDRYDAGEILVEDLAEALDWEQLGGWPFEPYGRLFDVGYDEGARFVAAGLPVGLPPDEAEYPVPGGYMSVLRDALGQGEMPLAAQSGFIRTMAWRDHQIASQSLAAWDGDGYLVILADRLHVEGGKGVSWQAGLRTRAPVHAFLLAWAHDPPCLSGDRIWSPGLSEKLAGATRPPSE